MSRLVTDLLTLARADAGLHLKLSPVSMRGIVTDVYRQLQLLANGRVLGLGTLADGEVWGDADYLKQLLLILADNAIKYTPSGGSILVEVEERDDCMVVVVADTGIGIAPADQARLFERFYRVKRRETIDIKGTGLGLAIVKSIAQWHGGRVWVESQLGSGSTFYFLVPLKA